MIWGAVDADLQAVVLVRVADSDGNWHELRAVIDTGYSGYLTLPPSIISSLRLSKSTTGSAMLADGSIGRFDVYEGMIFWGAEPQMFEIDESDIMPLVGMSLLAGHELRIRVAAGDSVTIEPLV